MTMIQASLLNVSTSAGYLIAVALNGPGIESLDKHKWTITARLRAYCGVPTGTVAAVRATPLTYADGRALHQEIEWMHQLFTLVLSDGELRTEFQNSIGHWVGHAGDAIGQLKHYLVVPDETLLWLDIYVTALLPAVRPWQYHGSWTAVHDAATALVTAEQAAGDAFDQFIWRDKPE